jgi:hypothetical protein
LRPRHFYLKTAAIVLLSFDYNFCLPFLDFGGYFATEDKELKREKERKAKEFNYGFKN